MDLEDQLESMMANMNYIQSNVTECQNSIMQMEEEAKVSSYLSLSFIYLWYVYYFLLYLSVFSKIVKNIYLVGLFCDILDLFVLCVG